MSALAQTAPRETSGKGPSGLPLPRFASLSASEANLRAGPGEKYPVRWVYQRKGYPLLITAEYEVWRQIKDAEGTEGWFNVALLSARRTALVTDGPLDFYDQPTAKSRLVFRAEKGVIGEILECRANWCRLEVEKREGWAPQAAMWGIFKDESLN